MELAKRTWRNGWKLGENKVEVDARRSSASSRRLSRDSVGNGSLRWGWSRSETERLVRMQAVARGYLLRRKVCRIPATDVETILKDLDQKDKGLRRLVGYLCFFLLFFAILLLESDVSFQYSVETGIRGFIEQIGSGSEDIRLADVATREEFSAWAVALYKEMYDGTEVEDLCNTCASLRGPGASNFFPSLDASLWGSTFPRSGETGTNGSFVFELDNCPLCYGTERSSVVDGSDEGQVFCTVVCSGSDYCFEDGCIDVDTPRAVTSEVKGTNASLVKVFSKGDCASGFSREFVPKDYGAKVGLTKLVADQAGMMSDDTYTFSPTGRGYVANRNRVLNTLLLEWTYYEDALCEDAFQTGFYDSCYKDAGSMVDKTEDVLTATMDPLAVVSVQKGSAGEGLVYSVTTDVGVYNFGLNLGLCNMLAVFGGSDVMTSAVRTVSLRFNTYNGQRRGLFSSVDITAIFSLGGEVQIVPTIRVFSMPQFFSGAPVVVARAVAMFLFGFILVYYTGKDLRHFLRELMDGRHRFKITFRRIPVTTATFVHLFGDVVFIGCLVLWINTAVYANGFDLEPTLSFDNASEQVRGFSEDLASVALKRWRRDALAVAGSMTGLARLFLMLRFHPRLSLVTDVLAASAIHLVHFFIMFFMVVVVYSNVGWIIFGPTSDLFATWPKSFITMTRIAMGEFDNIYPDMVVIDRDSAFLIIVTYQILQFILLLNIVVSILLDAFQMVQDRNAVHATDTLWQTIHTTLGRWRIRVMGTLCLVWHKGSPPKPRPKPLPPPGSRTPARDPLKARWHKLVRNTAGRPAVSPQSAPPAGGGGSSGDRPSAATHAPAAAAAVAAAAALSARVGRGESQMACPPAGQSQQQEEGGEEEHQQRGQEEHQQRGQEGPSAQGRPGLGLRALSSSVATRLRTSGGRQGSALTRGERIATLHRHYDMRTAAEVLRRSPLPEAAVRRKLRQIVGARLGLTALEKSGGWHVAGAGGGGQGMGFVDGEGGEAVRDKRRQQEQRRRRSPRRARTAVDKSEV